MELVRAYFLDFIQIFLLFLAVRLVLNAINGNGVFWEEILKTHIPTSVLFAALFAAVRLATRHFRKK